MPELEQGQILVSLEMRRAFTRVISIFEFISSFALGQSMLKEDRESKSLEAAEENQGHSSCTLLLLTASGYPASTLTNSFIDLPPFCGRVRSLNCRCILVRLI